MEGVATMPSTRELDSFTETTLARQRAAEEAGYAGDPEPYLRLWSQQDPVSLFGAFGPCKTGWTDVSRTMRWAITRFSDADMTHDLEVAYAGADLAYTVGYEHGEVAIDGVRQPVKLRVTLIYRREDGQWKLVHRHGDFAPVDQSPAG
jgi:ketosteroid isomerase-like protein